MMRISSVWLLAALTVAGCSVTTDADLSSRVDLPEVFENASGQNPADADSDTALWWRRWGDPELERVMRLALEGNLSLKTADLRIAEADAYAKMADADRGPSAALGAAGGFGRTSVSSPVSLPFLPDRISSSPRGAMGSVAASWEIDLFGRKQSDADVYAYRALGSRQQRQAAEIEIAGRVAGAYFQMCAASEKRKLLDDSLKELDNLRRYIRGRFEAGQARAADLKRVESEISHTASRASALAAAEKNLRMTIAALAGQIPEGFEVVCGEKLPDYEHAPAAPAGVYPSDLLQRRPDLAAKQSEIRSLAAAHASAVAELYPRLSLSFLWNTGALRISGDLEGVKGWGSALGADLVLPLYTGGRIRAGIDAADARLKAALADYDRRLLEALAEVERGYSNLKAGADRQRKLVQALADARALTSMLGKMFDLDAADYDRVVDAKLKEIGIRNEMLDAVLEYQQDLAGLFASLGGGWDRPEQAQGKQHGTDAMNRAEKSP
ncbi:MAG: TolC family protein [Succinivibrionaceae bacterium]|nr:TolC family protein [Succinivibrionaceae bacterium]